MTINNLKIWSENINPKYHFRNISVKTPRGAILASMGPLNIDKGITRAIRMKKKFNENAQFGYLFEDNDRKINDILPKTC